MKKTNTQFLVYVEELEALNELSNGDFGRLIRALMMFVKTEEEQKVPPRLAVAYRFMTSHIRRDTERYLEVSEKRRLAGKKSAEARKKAKADHLKQEVKDRLDLAVLRNIK